MECNKSNPQEQKALHLAACLCAVFPGLNEGCKLQVGWVISAELWTDISLMVPIETKVYGGMTSSSFYAFFF